MTKLLFCWSLTVLAILSSQYMFHNYNSYSLLFSTWVSEKYIRIWGQSLHGKVRTIFLVSILKAPIIREQLGRTYSDNQNHERQIFLFIDRKSVKKIKLLCTTFFVVWNFKNLLNFKNRIQHSNKTLIIKS